MASHDGYRYQAQLFRACAHPVRLRILDILSRQEACVCHLQTILGRPQPYISQQLAALREAGLVTDRRDGAVIYYRLADDRIARLLDGSRELLFTLFGPVPAFPPPPDKMVPNCPCPHCQE
jgi:ArsR family transcriptional regulator